MEVITNSLKIDKTLVKLMMKYKRYHIATAWASLGSNASKTLLNNKKRIKKMIVGTHFYQTHPDFIENFISSKQVNFILQTNGIYHPKVYLFSNQEDDWECVIGSANFTMSALSRNSEVVVHIKSTDKNVSNVYKKLLSTINGYWLESEPISKDDFHNYKNIWKKNKTNIKKLKGEYVILRFEKAGEKNWLFFKKKAE